MTYPVACPVPARESRDWEWWNGGIEREHFMALGKERSRISCSHSMQGLGGLPARPCQLCRVCLAHQGVCGEEAQRHERWLQETCAHFWPGARQILASCFTRLPIVYIDCIKNKSFVPSPPFLSAHVTARFSASFWLVP